ncbi:MAG: hypothetical protein RL142_811 [Actinomycetota bacterium]|jgi:hypothetical protein
MVDKASSGEPIEFWFNLKTGLVEVGKQSAAPYRVGPFDTEAEAATALKTIAERTAKWNDEEDERD